MVAAATLAACGSAASGTGAQNPTIKNPKAALLSSVGALEAQPTLAFDVHLATTPAQLEALIPGFPSPYAKLVTQASLVLQDATANGKPLGAANLTNESPAQAIAGLSNDEVDETFNVGGFKAYELRLVNGVVYLRLDVKDTLALVGYNQAKLAPIAKMIPAGAQYDFARAALAGKWVSFDALSEFKSFLSTAPTLPPAQSKANADKYLAALESVYNKDIAVATDGSVPGGTAKLAISANERNLASGVYGAFMNLATSLGTLGGAGGAPDLSKVPNTTIKAFAGIKDNALNEVAINLSQFIPGAAAKTNPLEMEVGVSHPAMSISAPSGATAASLGALTKLFGAASASGRSAMATPGTVVKPATATTGRA